MTLNFKNLQLPPNALNGHASAQRFTHWPSPIRVFKTSSVLPVGLTIAFTLTIVPMLFDIYPPRHHHPHPVSQALEQNLIKKGPQSNSNHRLLYTAQLSQRKVQV